MAFESGGEDDGTAPFERCPDCDTYAVNLATHAAIKGCDLEDRSPGTASPARDPSDDAGASPVPDGGSESSVGVFRRFGTSPDTYHDLDDGDPTCGCARNSSTPMLVLTRRQASEAGLERCRRCERRASDP